MHEDSVAISRSLVSFLAPLSIQSAAKLHVVFRSALAALV